MAVPDTACYSKRLASLVVIAGVLALGCLSEHVQAEHIYAQYEQDLLQSIAASAYVNLLLVSLYTTFYLATCIYRAVTLRRSSTSAAKQPDTVRSARIICLASDKDCEKLQFKELCRIQRVRASMRVDESDPHLIPVEYITPAWLWYYIYAVGTGVFVLGYLLHGGHQQASCVLACSLTLCSLYTCVAEAYQSGSTSDVVSRVCGLLFLTPAVVLLCIHASTNAQLEVDPDMPRRALQSAWLGLVLPLLTPLALHACRHRATSAAMTADMIVAFAMPFVAALSVSYLSVYTPTHAAWIDHHVADVTLWWHGNITVTTLAERHARQVSKRLPYVFAIFYSIADFQTRRSGATSCCCGLCGLPSRGPCT